MKYLAAYKAFVVSKGIEMKKRKNVVGRTEIPAPVARSLRMHGGYERLVAGIPKRGDLAPAAKEHEVLSDMTRLKILHALARSSLCPCLLKRITRVADSKLSYHLKVLEDAGLIKSRRTKSWRIYSITPRGRKVVSPRRRTSA